MHVVYLWYEENALCVPVVWIVHLVYLCYLILCIVCAAVSFTLTPLVSQWHQRLVHSPSPLYLHTSLPFCFEYYHFSCFLFVWKSWMNYVCVACLLLRGLLGRRTMLVGGLLAASKGGMGATFFVGQILRFVLVGVLSYVVCWEGLKGMKKS